jgi:hypothetical protein
MSEANDTGQTPISHAQTLDELAFSIGRDPRLR